MTMTPSWPKISASLFYDDAPAAIAWLCKAFGFEVRLKCDGADGSVEHSELIMGDGLIMVSSASKRALNKSPRSQGGVNTQCLFIYVDDVEAHCAHARAAGAKIVTEPTTTDYGAEYWADRCYEVEDPEGHRWWIGQRVRNRK